MKFTKYIQALLITVAIMSGGCEDQYLDAPANPDKEKLLRLVNEVRATGCNCGNDYYPPVNAVVWNEQLEEAAQKHSTDMKKHKDLNHEGSDGSSAGDRINATGYSWNTYGENIAVGYPTEEKVIQGWLQSIGHCKNIMNGNFTQMGVATSGAYWTQVFARPN